MRLCIAWLWLCALPGLAAAQTAPAARFPHTVRVVGEADSAGGPIRNFLSLGLLDAGYEVEGMNLDASADRVLRAVGIKPEVEGDRLATTDVVVRFEGKVRRRLDPQTSELILVVRATRGGSGKPLAVKTVISPPFPSRQKDLSQVALKKHSDAALGPILAQLAQHFRPRPVSGQHLHLYFYKTPAAYLAKARQALRSLCPYVREIALKKDLLLWHLHCKEERSKILVPLQGVIQTEQARFEPHLTDTLLVAFWTDMP